MHPAHTFQYPKVTPVAQSGAPKPAVAAPSVTETPRPQR
ncbi:MAG: hypothetical protein JWR63_443 [Conexibacter sp.]|nr:hypothetical protein [Conexibacter sp.]